MKRPFIILSILLAGVITYSQEGLHKNHKNKIGVDLMPFMKKMMDFGKSSNYFTPDYFICYKRNINSWALRTSAGCTFSKNDYMESDSTKYKVKNNGLLFKIGIESSANIIKNLDFLYGLDLYYQSKQEFTDYYYQNTGGFSYEEKNISNRASLFIGVEYWLSQRISIATETSFDIGYFINTFEPNSVASTNEKGWQAVYKYPFSLLLAYQF